MSAPRHELKYWCDDEAWELLLIELRGLVAVDPHVSAERPWYTVSSLYLDTEDLAEYHAKLDGLARRGKVRIRRYDRERSGFIELKARAGRLIIKHRVPLDAGALEAVASGRCEPLEAALGRHEGAGRLLTELRLRRLRPSVITRYERAAYMLVDDPAVRITLDRSLACHGSELSSTFLREDVDHAPMKTMLTPNILEVKFTGNMPPFLGASLRRLGLRWRSISKYCRAIETLAKTEAGVADV